MTPLCAKILAAASLTPPEGATILAFPIDSLDALLHIAFDDGKEQAYVAGKEMERALMRLRLGLSVPGDSE